MRVVLAGGGSVELGTTETTPTIGITDYSRRVTDDFGVTTVVERGFARTMSVRLQLPFADVDATQRLMAGLRATKAQWIADERYAWLRPTGFYKDFGIDLAVPPASFCTLTVEGTAETEVAADPGGDPAPDGSHSTFHLLQPVPVTDGVLVASSVGEDDASGWAADTAYAIGARVIRAGTHRVYESVVAGNTGHDPAAGATQWLDVGPTNRWAMLDQALGTATTGAGVIAVTLAAGAIDAVALLDVAGASVRVQAPGYDRTLPVGAGAITFLDLPGADGQVTVTVAGDGQVSVGTLLVGQLVALGLTEASPTAAITDYSRKAVDDFGEVTVVQRAWAKRMTARALIRTDALDVVANRIAAVRARPSLWIGQAGMDSLTVYGFFKDFSIEVDGSTSKLSLSIEGLSTAAKIAPLTAATAWPDVTDPLGTKPEDSATRGSPAGTTVGGVRQPDGSIDGGQDAADVVTSIELNANSLIEQALRQDDAAEVQNARDFHEGQPVKTVLLTFRNEQTTQNSAVNSLLALLGAKSPDGTGFVLDLSSVRVAADKTLAQRFAEIGAANGDVAANVQQLMEAVVEPGGTGHARFLLRGVTNGGQVAIDGFADQDGSYLNFVADRVRYVDASGTNPVKTLEYVNGRWEFTADVYVKKLVADTVEAGNLKASAALQTVFQTTTAPTVIPKAS